MRSPSRWAAVGPQNVQLGCNSVSPLTRRTIRRLGSWRRSRHSPARRKRPWAGDTTSPHSTQRAMARRSGLVRQIAHERRRAASSRRWRMRSSMRSIGPPFPSESLSLSWCGGGKFDSSANGRNVGANGWLGASCRADARVRMAGRMGDGGRHVARAGCARGAAGSACLPSGAAGNVCPKSSTVGNVCPLVGAAGSACLLWGCGLCACLPSGAAGSACLPSGAYRSAHSYLGSTTICVLTVRKTAGGQKKNVPLAHRFWLGSKTCVLAECRQPTVPPLRYETAYATGCHVSRAPRLGKVLRKAHAPAAGPAGGGRGRTKRARRECRHRPVRAPHPRGNPTCSTSSPTRRARS